MSPEPEGGDPPDGTVVVGGGGAEVGGGADDYDNMLLLTATISYNTLLTPGMHCEYHWLLATQVDPAAHVVGPVHP